MGEDSPRQWIESIDWSRVGSNVSDAHWRKVTEFLKLIAQVYLRRDKTARHPFNDPREILDEPSLLASDPDIPESVAFAKCPVVVRVVKLYLLGSQLADLGVENAEALQRAYEQLIDVFEDGGTIDYRHEGLTVDDWWTDPLRGWIEKYGHGR